MKTVLSLLALALLSSCAFKIKTPVPFTGNAVSVGAAVQLTLETEPADFQLPGEAELQILK